MKLYLAGPMRGIPDFNFPAFHNAAASLRELGHEVFSPAERDNERHGRDIATGNKTGSLEEAVKNHGFSLRHALADDTQFICLHAEGIALLPGWENSAGANAEVALAKALGLQIIFLNKGGECGNNIQEAA